MKEIDRLIGLLDDESTEVAENAKAELASMGLVALGPLVAAAPSLQPYGQLSAIEIFEELADPSAGPVLVDLLDSPVATVREWSAYALAHLRVAQAVPALREACRRSRQRGTPPDYSEPVALRHALTELGARRQVQPPLTASLRATAGALRETWPVARLQEVIDDLADHGQAVLYFKLWTVTDTGTFWTSHDTLDKDFDLHVPWEQVVAAAREAAQLEAAFVPQRDDIVATIEWIDESDR